MCVYTITAGISTSRTEYSSEAILFTQQKKNAIFPGIEALEMSCTTKLVRTLSNIDEPTSVNQQPRQS